MLRARFMASSAENRASGSLRVGTDIVEIRDVRTSLETFGRRYVNRVYTAREHSDACAASIDLAPHLAARFAAKEAALKVLRPSKDDAIPLSEIETVKMAGGHCELVLHGEARRAAERAGLVSFAVSLSHEAHYATAVVVAQPEDPRDVAFAPSQP